MSNAIYVRPSKVNSHWLHCGPRQTNRCDQLSTRRPEVKFFIKHKLIFFDICSLHNINDRLILQPL